MKLFVMLFLFVPPIIFVILFIIHCVVCHNHKRIRDAFKHCNVFVYGKKRTGKDLVFAWIIKWRHKHEKYNHYWANISYGFNFHHIELSQISCMPNTFENFINNDIKPCSYCLYEHEDVYISDLGVYLPSQYDSMLHKKFPSFPIYYALSGQLAAHNIHCNCQNLERGWKAIREQADFFINTTKTIRIFGLLFTKGIIYEKYKAASASMLPMKKPSIFAKDCEKATYKQYVSTWGLIENFIICNRIKSLKYDTRAFRKIVYIDMPLKDRISIHKDFRKLVKTHHKLNKAVKRKFSKYLRCELKIK